MIKAEIKNGTGMLTLNRPEKRNALHPDLISEIIDKLEEWGDDVQVKSIIITGAGKSFCAGADLKYLDSLRSNSIIDNQKDSERIAELILSVYECSKPVIAAVNGAAIAGGCGLASACDFVIADRVDAKFGYSEVRIGFIPAIVSFLAVARMGEFKARQLLITADIIDAEEALDVGLADKLSSDVVGDAMKLTEKLNGNSARGIKDTRDMIRTISKMNYKSAVDYCVNLNTLSRTTDEFKKGLADFLNKVRG